MNELLSKLTGEQALQERPGGRPGRDRVSGCVLPRTKRVAQRRYGNRVARLRQTDLESRPGCGGFERPGRNGRHPRMGGVRPKTCTTISASGERTRTTTVSGSASRCRSRRGVETPLDAAYEKVRGGLVNMMANADQWCISSSQVREDGAEYEVTEGLTYPHTPTPTNMGENNQFSANT